MKPAPLTAQKVAALRKLLQESQSKANSPALDAEILSHAKAQAQRTRLGFAQRLCSLFPLSVGAAALMSMVVTASVFLVMSRMVAVPQPELAELQLTPQSIVRPAPVNIARSANSLPAGSLLSHALRPQVINYSADQILQEVQLPSVTALVAKMEFSQAADRWVASSSLSVAFADIASLVGIGRYDDARKRYADLRASCKVCQLPNSLEALALGNAGTPSSG